MLIKSILLIFLKISLSLNTCIIEENHCERCNPVTKLCVKCDKNIYVPDKNGGCKNSHKCIMGENQCLTCNENENLCKECEVGFFPDENGGCSYTDNCEISYRGECLECKEDFILIGEKNFYDEGQIKICKSKIFGDLKNCEEINKSKGVCEKCKEGFYLNSGDKKCSQVENCYESTFEVCKKCNKNYYLDRKESKCKNQTDIFLNCKESFDGKTCYICDDDYYFDEEGKCIKVNYCLKSLNEYQCEKCAPGFFPNNFGTSCVTTENCNNGDSNIGICTSCNEGYYIDYNDGKCKSNQENNDFKYCRIADEGICTQCFRNWELGEDNKCSDTKFCADSSNGKCLECSDNYYLGLDNKCTNVEHCIYSNDYTCFECEDKFYYDEEDKKCLPAEGKFKNCKSANSKSFCNICKDNFYLNQSDNLCYSNQEKGKFYKCVKTDLEGDHCIECMDDFYLGDKDNKCSTIERCALSENENKCLECDLYFCLDVKKGECIYNEDIEDEDKKFYFRCHKTNEEGTACEICDEGFILGEDGICVEDENIPIIGSCKEGSDNCEKCNPVTKICLKCEKNIYTINKKGECELSQKCEMGENYCNECNEEGNLCKICDEGYNPDEIGGCSYSKNCEISFQGKCLKCKNNFVLYEKAGICKSINSEDFKNCKKINKAIGLCEECNDNYFLNEEDKRCTTTKNCAESSLGECTKCISGFYLDKENKECKQQSDNFINCQISNDGKICDLCNEDYFFDEDGKCVNSNFCSKSDNKGKCEKCIDNYYLSASDKICTTEKNCEKGLGDIGVCLSCAKNYVIDLSDGKCKSNQEDNDLKYCESADGKCNKCISGFELDKEGKCTTSTNCAKSNNGLCQECVEDYYLGLDFKCTNVMHCIKSYEYECLECEENYYYNRDNKTCFSAEGKYENCQYGVNEFCLRCNDDFYLNRKDHLCYTNLEKNEFYKCAMTDIDEEKCFVCVEDYYLGIKDFKCSKAEDCDITEDENRCLECRENYCLNAKTGLCVSNYEIDEENKFYYKCKKTKAEGTECEICIEGFSLDSTGVCV